MSSILPDRKPDRGAFFRAPRLRNAGCHRSDPSLPGQSTVALPQKPFRPFPRLGGRLEAGVVRWSGSRRGGRRARCRCGAAAAEHGERFSSTGHVAACRRSPHARGPASLPSERPSSSTSHWKKPPTRIFAPPPAAQTGVPVRPRRVGLGEVAGAGDGVSAAPTGTLASQRKTSERPEARHVLHGGRERAASAPSTSGRLGTPRPHRHDGEAVPTTGTATATSPIRPRRTRVPPLVDPATRPRRHEERSARRAGGRGSNSFKRPRPLPTKLVRLNHGDFRAARRAGLGWRASAGRRGGQDNRPARRPSSRRRGGGVGVDRTWTSARRGSTGVASSCDAAA